MPYSPSAFRCPILPAALLLSLGLTACTTSQDVASRTDGFNDPYESQNRAIHEFNKDLDTVVVSPLSRGYAAVLPSEVRSVVNNFSNNLDEPGDVINSLLQGDFRGAGVSTVRFVMNTTIGIAGLVDAAGELGIDDHDADFGQTLAVWGVGEGAYIELPVFGGSTQRDATGLVVDFFTNPLTFATLDESPEQYIPPVALALETLDFRDRFRDTIDSVLYESADSYALTRQTYLQNRRFELGDAPEEDIDPFAEVFGE